MACRVGICQHSAAYEGTAFGAPGNLESAFQSSMVWVVPTYGYAHFLSLQETAQNGICFSPPVYFPAQFLWRLVQSAYGDTPDTAPLDQHRMALLILSLFQSQDPSILALSPFLSRADVLSQYRLAVSLARLFERYRTYRPDWLISWAQGIWTEALPEAYRWQGALWQRVAPMMGIQADRHPILDWIQLVEHSCPPGIPERVILFFLPSLIPLYWQAFSVLSQWCEVEAWFLLPADMYWGDLTPEELVHIPASFLLSSWGRQAHDLLQILLSDTRVIWMTPSPPVRSSSTLLSTVQAHIASFESVDSLPPLDDSLQICSCADFLSELRAAKAWLLRLLGDPQAEVSPSDVLVWIPDLEGAQNHLHAVFGDIATGYLPYRLSGLTVAVPSAKGFFLACLHLLKTRFVCEEVWAFFHAHGVFDQWGWTASTIRECRAMLQSVEMSWGIDGAHVAAYGGTGDDRYTWLGSISALYLSLCFDRDQQVYQEYVLSTRSYSLSQVASLDQLYHFFILVGAWRCWVERVQPLSVWVSEAALLLTALEEQVYPGCERLYDVLDSHTQGLPEVMLSYDAFVQLCEAFWSPQNPAVSPQPSVLCAPFGSLRALPYRVVLCLGMQKAVLPMQEHPSEYDLLRYAPRPGDRYVSDEQKAALLDILVQSEYCYLSYHDDSLYGEQARSFLVDDLCFFLSMLSREEDRSRWVRRYTSPALSAGPDPIEVRPKLSSLGSRQVPSFFSVSSLSRIVLSPTRFFLNNCLGLSFPERGSVQTDHEPDRLSYYHYPSLFAEAYRLCVHGATVDMLYQHLSRHPMVPPLAEVSEVCLAAYQYHHLRQDLLGQLSPSCFTHCYHEDSYRISGYVQEMHHVHQHRIFCHHAAHLVMTPYQIMRHWIRHVWASTEARYPVLSCVADQSRLMILPALPVVVAQEQMAAFLRLAIAAHAGVVPFYVSSAYAYTQASDPEMARDKAHVVWRGHTYARGEKQAPELVWCAVDDHPYADEVCIHWAQAIWGGFHEYVRFLPMKRPQEGWHAFIYDTVLSQ